MRYLVLLFPLVVLGCGDSLVAAIEADRVPVAPLSEYAGWYAEMEGCAGVTGDFAAVRWFAIDEFRYQGGRIGWGGVFRPDHDITILTKYRRLDEIVHHEMLHHILHTSGDRSHRTHKHPAFGACAPI